MPTPRVLFFGYSEVGYATLELLLARSVSVAAVFTHADDPHETAWFRSVPRLAAQRGLPVFTPESLKDPAWETRLRELCPDLILSMYYRNMIPMRLLDLAPLGAFNLHGSFLPRYRGRAPLNWAILHGEDHTGVSLHVMLKEADAGDIIDQQKVPIGPDEPVSAVIPRVRDAAVSVLGRQLDALLAGRAPRHPQDHRLATYFGKRTAEDGRLDWTRPAREVYNLVRALTHPFPGAFADVVRSGVTTRITVWWGRPLDHSAPAVPGTILHTDPLTIACGAGAFEISQAEWTTPTRPPQPASAPLLHPGEPL
ncbi:MAG: formyltransferase [Opitutales bacterium]|jgi:methionyl-tRNA formyltransferase